MNLLVFFFLVGISVACFRKKIKEDRQTKNIPVVMLTVRTSSDSKQKSFEYAHCDAHIDKPFAMEKLLATIEKLLEK